MKSNRDPATFQQRGPNLQSVIVVGRKEIDIGVLQARGNSVTVKLAGQEMIRETFDRGIYRDGEGVQ